MRSWKRALLTSAVVTLAAPGSALAGAPQSVSQQYTMDPNAVPAVDTGFTVKPTSPVSVSATGLLSCSGPVGGTFCNVDPDGDPSFDTTVSSFGGFLLPGAPAWGLLAKVGSGPWTHVGSGPTTLSGSGNLVFAVNDDLYGDNHGNFTPTVSYQCYSGNGNGDRNHYHCGPPGRG